jgi:hypothetical protein
MQTLSSRPHLKKQKLKSQIQQNKTRIKNMNTELELIEETQIAKAFEPNGADAIINAVKQKISGVVFDISTLKGRKECASAAAKIASTKVKLDDMGKQLKAEWAAKCNAIDGERKKIRDELDALKEEIRKPLTDWETAEKERKAKAERLIESLKTVKMRIESLDTANKELLAVNGIDASLHGDFANDIEREKRYAIELINVYIINETKRIEEQKELEELRKQAAEREAKELAERQAREAEERKKAEEEARKIREEQIRKEAEERAKREAEEAERKKQLERERIEREERLKIEREAQAKVEAAERQAREAKEAQERAKREQEESERKRKAEEDRKAAELAAKEADQKHRAKIHGGILQSFVKIGCDETTAKNIVIAIAKNEIQNLKINY